MLARGEERVVRRGLTAESAEDRAGDEREDGDGNDADSQTQLPAEVQVPARGGVYGRPVQEDGRREACQRPLRRHVGEDAAKGAELLQAEGGEEARHLAGVGTSLARRRQHAPCGIARDIVARRQSCMVQAVGDHVREARGEAGEHEGEILGARREVEGGVGDDFLEGIEAQRRPLVPRHGEQELRSDLTKGVGAEDSRYVHDRRPHIRMKIPVKSYSMQWKRTYGYERSEMIVSGQIRCIPGQSQSMLGLLTLAAIPPVV